MITDEQIGRNLMVLRSDMSQKDLADHMRKRGFKWSQATVWAIEKGERPLRLTESEAIGAIFDIHGNALTSTTTEFDRTMTARAHYDRMQQIADLAYASFERQRLFAIACDQIPEDERDQDGTPEFIARNAIDFAIEGLARAEAHFRGEMEVNALIDGRYPHDGQEYHQAFLAHVRAQIAEYREQTAAEQKREQIDGIDQAET